MNTPDPALASVIRQLSTTSGMTIRIVHPGSLRDDDARRAFSGLVDEAVDLLAAGEPHLSIENDQVMIDIEREIVSALIRNTASSGRFGCWAAFATPDGQVDVVLPRSGANVVHGPFPAHGRAA